MSYLQETICIQGGYQPKKGEPRILPLVQSTTFKYDTADEVAQLFNLEAAGHMYSRISNPTVEGLEKKLAELEGGVGALCTSSGQSANLISILTICHHNEHVVAISNLYGGTYTLFSSTLKKMGIEVTFVDYKDGVKGLEKAIKDNTKLVFGETIGNPSVDVLDIKAIADVAHSHGLPLIIDNTFATPYLCRPFEHGADIVTHSTTKYCDGHATSVGGVIIDSGKFDWSQGRHYHLTDPDPSYHGLSYTDTFKESAYILKARVSLLRDMGNTMSPFNAFLTNLGLETLALRMERHSQNALEVAKFLQSHPKVEWVKYPGLETDPSYELCQKYLSKGSSGIVAFGVKGKEEEGKKFIDALELASLVVHVGDIRTHVLHPASMTHRQLTKEQQLLAGVTPEMIRLSVGIEGIKDIIADLDQALNLI